MGSPITVSVLFQGSLMLLLIDNYDSFTWNLVQYFGALGQEVQVRRNDELSLDEIIRLAPAIW